MLAFHTASGILALVTGTAIAFSQKGTTLHRKVGWVYAGSMYGLCLSSLLISADILPFFTIGDITRHLSSLRCVGHASA